MRKTAILLLVMMSSSTAWSQELGVASGLTADEAARRAVKHAPAAAEAAARADETAAKKDELGRNWLPRATLTARYTRISPEDPSVVSLPQFSLMFEIPAPLDNQWLFAAQVVVPLSDYFLRVGQGVAAAAGGERAQRFLTVVAERKAALDARVAYWSWVRARLAVAVFEQGTTQATTHVELVEKLFRAGSLPEADLLLARARLAQANLDLARARHTAELAGRQLHVLLGDPTRTSYAIGEDPRQPHAAETGSLESYLAAARQKRPELLALGESEASLASERKAARAGYLPRLDLVGNLAYQNPNPRGFPQEDAFDLIWDVSAVASWTLNDSLVTRDRMRGYEARQVQISAQRRALFDGLELEVAAAWRALGDAEAALTASGDILAAAEEGYRARRKLFEVGRATATDLLDAESELVRARLGLLDAQVGWRIARVLLDHAVGA